MKTPTAMDNLYGYLLTYGSAEARLYLCDIDRQMNDLLANWLEEREEHDLLKLREQELLDYIDMLKENK